MDSRANIKIEFAVFGQTYDVNMNINYHPSYDCADVDPRVVDWFCVAYKDAVTKHLANLQGTVPSEITEFE